MSPKFVFFGTPQFSVIILEELAAAGLLPDLVVTAPDKPAGRGMELTPPPVKIWALKHSIPVLQPEKLDEDFVSKLLTADCNLFLVAAYGKILPKSVLDIPIRGAVNVHPSLLPYYRGASPIESQILADEKSVGVSIMLMDELMDHGPLLALELVTIPDWPVGKKKLTDILAHAGGKALAQVIPEWIAENIKALPQNHEQATFTKKIEKEDGEIDLSASARENYLKYLAYEGWPGTYFFVEKNGTPLRVKIAEASLKDSEFLIKRVIPEGKSEMSYEDFVRSVNISAK